MSSKGKIESLLRGAGQGATLGWGDEVSPYGTQALEWMFGGPEDPDGIPREYAAGSQYADQLANERRENQEAREANPKTFLAGQVAGALPSSYLASAAGAGAGANLAQQVAATGLLGGLRGGVEGAGLSDEGDRLKGAAAGAGTGAALGMAGAAAPTAVRAVKDLFKGGPPNMSGLAPAYATVGTGAAREAGEGAASKGASTAAGAMLNKSTSVPSAAGPRNAPPPKNTMPPPRRGKPAQVPEPEPEPEAEIVPRRDAMRPPSSLRAEIEGATTTPGSPQLPTEATPRMPRIDPRQYGNLGDYFQAQKDALHEAWGKSPSWQPPNEAQMVAQRGPSMIDALAEENSPQQLARLPKVESEYAEAGANAGARRAAARAARGKTTPLPMQNESTFVPGESSVAPTDEFSFTPEADAAGEFKLPSKGITVEKTSKTPAGVEKESVSVKAGKPKKSDKPIEDLMKVARRDDE